MPQHHTTLAVERCFRSDYAMQLMQGVEIRQNLFINHSNHDLFLFNSIKERDFADISINHDIPDISSIVGSRLSSVMAFVRQGWPYKYI